MSSDEQLAIQKEIAGCGQLGTVRSQRSCFAEVMKPHAKTVTEKLRSGALRLNPAVRESIFRSCKLQQRTDYVSDLVECTRDALELLRSELAEVASESKAGDALAMVGSTHPLARTIEAKCGKSPSDACFKSQLKLLRAELGLAYKDYNAGFDSLVWWMALSQGCAEKAGGDCGKSKTLIPGKVDYVALTPSEAGNGSDCDQGDAGLDPTGGIGWAAALDKFKEGAECVTLEAGKSRIIDDDNAGVSTGGVAYTLRRLRDRELSEPYVSFDGKKVRKGASVPVYQISVNVRFSKPEYEARAQTCYDQARPKLRGPGGEFLEIYLNSAGGEFKSADRIDININDDPGHRANAADWSADIDCPTILHETFHRLGLADEYQELWMGKAVLSDGSVHELSNLSTAPSDAKLFPKWDCRSVGPADSLMSQQCGAYLASGLPLSSRCTSAGFSPLTDEREVRPSLLYPAHFRAVTQPGCANVNGLYYECTEAAYKTSNSWRGKKDCPKLPAACGNKTWVY